jgi:hypothetical protein
MACKISERLFSDGVLLAPQKWEIDDSINPVFRATWRAVIPETLKAALSLWPKV